jgi:hypothetical protein
MASCDSVIFRCWIGIVDVIGKMRMQFAFQNRFGESAGQRVEDPVIAGKSLNRLQRPQGLDPIERVINGRYSRVEMSALTQDL